MPQYDYRCQDCRETFTIERSMNESSDPDCASCGGKGVNRIWNVTILTGGSKQDVGQGMSASAGTTKSGCGSCSSNSCGTCH